MSTLKTESNIEHVLDAFVDSFIATMLVFENGGPLTTNNGLGKSASSGMRQIRDVCCAYVTANFGEASKDPAKAGYEFYGAREVADAGYVKWDTVPARGVNYQTHKFSVIDAFETASNMIFAGADEEASGNIIVLGSAMISVVVSLPQYASKDGKVPEKRCISHIGFLDSKKVFADWRLPADEFLVAYAPGDISGLSFQKAKGDRIARGIATRETDRTAEDSAVRAVASFAHET